MKAPQRHSRETPHRASSPHLKGQTPSETRVFFYGVEGCARSALSDALHAAFAEAERGGKKASGSSKETKATAAAGGAPSDKLWPKMDPTRCVGGHTRQTGARGIS
jgi:hypothetical protein